MCERTNMCVCLDLCVLRHEGLCMCVSVNVEYVYMMSVYVCVLGEGQYQGGEGGRHKLPAPEGPYYIADSTQLW